MNIRNECVKVAVNIHLFDTKFQVVIIHEKKDTLNWEVLKFTKLYRSFFMGFIHTYILLSHKYFSLIAHSPKLLQLVFFYSINSKML